MSNVTLARGTPKDGLRVSKRALASIRTGPLLLPKRLGRSTRGLSGDLQYAIYLMVIVPFMPRSARSGTDQV
jgi:hypothetical protein